MNKQGCVKIPIHQCNWKKKRVNLFPGSYFFKWIRFCVSFTTTQSPVMLHVTHQTARCTPPVACARCRTGWVRGESCWKWGSCRNRPCSSWLSPPLWWKQPCELLSRGEMTPWTTERLNGPQRLPVPADGTSMLTTSILSKYIITPPLKRRATQTPLNINFQKKCTF